MQKVVVKKVVDGDTVHVLDSKNNLIKVRMHGIDSAESHLVTEHGVVGQQPWGDQAAESMAQILQKGSKVELEYFGQDKYGRTLGHLVVNGLNANVEQVRLGHAISYVICELGRCTDKNLEEVRSGEIMEACRAAQKAGRGVFNPSKPLREMPFEFRLRHQKRKADKYVGNMLTREYLSPDRYKEIPVCDRVFFLSEKDAQNLGFKKN